MKRIPRRLVCTLGVAAAAAVGSAVPAGAEPPDLNDPCGRITSCEPLVAAPARTTYKQEVLADRPVAYYPLAGDLRDHSGNGHHGRSVGRVPATDMFGSAGSARRFDGKSYVEVEDHDGFSVPPGGALTLEAWIRPDTLKFADEVDSSQPTKRYVHWMGKGTPGSHEYATRMYSNDAYPPGVPETHTDYRPNRVSGYAFKPAGGEGNGSYFQENRTNCPQKVTAGQWMHVVVVINTAPHGMFPDGSTKIYRNGVLCDEDSLRQSGPGLIHPTNKSAPFRIGTQEGMASFFQGGMAKVAVYGYELPGGRVQDHYAHLR